ncbi:hypothetical protein CCR94_01995 [Rhodoblastus sphagnicola]|uniref:Antirepressor protein ant N-terminal domain-containing protein n=1 Tax=Rhodoblastus sphagnicola TaxID=333368 RepID=A0A2S6NFK9_9HYPH|nr:hypothetical protein [Rhodoblastus sphagnicola]MBB4199197.1 hypothetical protein [Rhodoblastus sphagnicola]PPQ33393.1 hypothetical protein CCR94_01995 [Rhodoblastus sphagnicola]
MIDPIHTATINGCPVRFFASAIPQDLPWVAWPDVLAAVGYGWIKRTSVTRKLRAAHAGEIVESPTAKGRAVIVPNFMAEAILWIETRHKHIAPGADADFVTATQRAHAAAIANHPLAATPAAGSA